MSLDSLKSALPDYAKDLKLNLGSVIGNSDLPTQQLWGTVLVTAIASRSPIVLRELAPEAKANLSPQAYTAAKSAAAVMAMNNVFYRTRHLLSDHEYGTLRAGLADERHRQPRGRRSTSSCGRSRCRRSTAAGCAWTRTSRCSARQVSTVRSSRRLSRSLR